MFEPSLRRDDYSYKGTFSGRWESFGRWPHYVHFSERHGEAIREQVLLRDAPPRRWPAGSGDSFVVEIMSAGGEDSLLIARMPFQQTLLGTVERALTITRGTPTPARVNLDAAKNDLYAPPSDLGHHFRGRDVVQSAERLLRCRDRQLAALFTQRNTRLGGGSRPQ